MSRPLKIGIIAGEASGDLLGAGLIEAVRARVPEARFEGIGGPRMQALGCDSLYPMERLSVMGLVEPLRHLPGLLAMRRALVHRFLESPPDVFVGVDAPDFNLALERRLKALQRALRAAERAGDRARVEALVQEQQACLHERQKLLRELGPRAPQAQGQGQGGGGDEHG